MIFKICHIIIRFYQNTFILTSHFPFLFTAITFLACKWMSKAYLVILYIKWVSLLGFGEAFLFFTLFCSVHLFANSVILKAVRVQRPREIKPILCSSQSTEATDKDKQQYLVLYRGQEAVQPGDLLKLNIASFYVFSASYGSISWSEFTITKRKNIHLLGFHIRIMLLY